MPMPIKSSERSKSRASSREIIGRKTILQQRCPETAAAVIHARSSHGLDLLLIFAILRHRMYVPKDGQSDETVFYYAAGGRRCDRSVRATGDAADDRRRAG